MLRSDHLPLKKFLRKMTLNNTVNNWSTEIESFNINFIHIAGKANVLADTLSRLIDTTLTYSNNLSWKVMSSENIVLKLSPKREDP